MVAVTQVLSRSVIVTRPLIRATRSGLAILSLLLRVHEPSQLEYLCSNGVAICADLHAGSMTVMRIGHAVVLENKKSKHPV